MTKASNTYVQCLYTFFNSQIYDIIITMLNNYNIMKIVYNIIIQ